MGRFITYIGSPCSAMRKAQLRLEEQEEQKPIYVPKVGDILVHNSETNEDKVVPYSKWLQLEDSWDIVGLYGITTYEEENAENGYYVIMSNGTTLIIAPEDYEKVNTNWEQVDTVIVPTSITRTLTCKYVPSPGGSGSDSGSGNGSGDSSTKLFNNINNFADSIESMTIDGNEQSSIVDSYDFGNENEHTVVFTLKDSVTSIGNFAFSDCSSLTSITIPNSVTSIGENAFYYCSSLTSINIPSSVTSIGKQAFDYCPHLTSIDIPDSVTSIGEYVFLNCPRLTSVTIPDGVTSIDNGAFSNCNSLTSINIPNSVTTIGNRAFDYCSSLTSIEIPNSVTSIGNFAFNGCSSLASLTVKATTPPAIDNMGISLNSTVVVYVPAQSVSAYKSNNRWSRYESQIQAIP